MFGNLGNIANLVKQARSFQENLQKVQETLGEKRYEGEAGAGMVKVEVNGRGELTRVKIDPQAAGDLELIEDLIVAAAAAANRKSQEGMKAEMSQLTGGMNIPGLSDMLGQAT